MCWILCFLLCRTFLLYKESIKSLNNQIYKQSDRINQLGWHDVSPALKPGQPGEPHLFTSFTGYICNSLPWENEASRNNKVTGFQWVPAAFRAGPGKPSTAFLGFWKKWLFPGFVAFDIKSILQPSASPVSYRCAAAESVTWQHTKTSARFHLGDSIHRVRLPKVLLTGMHSNPVSKRHNGLLLYLFVDSHKFRHGKNLSFEGGELDAATGGAKGHFDWN